MSSARTVAPKGQAARDANSAVSAQVDEQVFGHRVAWRGNFAYRADVLGDTQIRDLVTDCYALHAVVPDYSTDIADAWTVVEQMRAGNWWPEVKYLVDWDNVAKWYAAYHQPPHQWSATADTAPLAICRAALLAVEHTA